MNRALIITLAAASIAVCARAGEVITTAAGGPADAVPAASASAPILIPDRYDLGDDILRRVGPCGAVARTADGKPDKNPHGEVYAGVGTHGYREGGGVVCLPIGDHASATIAVDVGHIDGRGWRR